MISVLGFLAALGPLVVFHEFGHYLFAKLFGVKPEVFSIGFGPKIASKQIGETEWRLSWIPLGGYVKLLGDDGERELTPEEKKRSLQSAKAWQRFFIFFGGPLFNLILAVLIFMFILAYGEPQMASVVGRVVSGSAAEKAGFQSGDKIVRIDGQPVRKYEEVILKINESPNRAMVFDVVRSHGGQEAQVRVTPAPQEGLSVYGEATHVGEIEGMLPMARATVVGVSDASGPAGKLGIKTGDKITQLDGNPLPSWEELERAYELAAPGTVLRLTLESGASLSAVKTKGKTLTEMTGLRSSELFIDKVVKDSPAEQAGLKVGDRLVSINGTVMESFFELKDAVQRSGEKDGKLLLAYEREGKIENLDLNPKGTESKDILLRKVTQFTIGVMPALVWAPPFEVVERILNPFTLIHKATARTVEFSRRNIVSIGKMFSGNVSVATLGGPILIGKIAGDSLTRGLIAFLTTMAILSVGLGVLNLLPVPVLDGGHLVLLGLEVIRGKPLSLRQMEIVQQVGLSLILLLMVVVIRNDIARLPFFD